MQLVNLTNKITWQDNFKLKTVWYSYHFLNFFLRLMKFLLYRKNSNPRKILIFRTGSLGDSLCAIPSIAGIRKAYPNATIDILTNPGKSSLVSIDQLISHEYYDNVINYFDLGTMGLVKMLRKNHYDMVIQLPQAISAFWRLARDLLFFRFVASSGWGWKVGKIFFFRKVQEKYIEYDTESVRLAKIASENKVSVDINNYPLNISAEDEVVVKNKFRELEITGRKIIGIAVGAKRPQNRWPIDNVKQIVRNFSTDHHIIILGGQEDYDLAKQLCIFPNVFNLCGSFTPMQSAVAFKKCSVFLSNDTGPLHLSYAVGTPVVATFTSRDFIGTWFPPKSKKNIVFRTENVPCSICLSETCPDNICIRAIKPSLVYAAMAGLIAEDVTN